MSKYYKGNLVFTNDIEPIKYQIFVYNEILDFSSEEFMEKYRKLRYPEKDIIRNFFLFYKDLNDSQKEKGISILSEMFKNSILSKHYSNNNKEVIYEIIVDVDGNLYGKEILTGAVFPIISKRKIEVSDKYNNETFLSNHSKAATDDLYCLYAYREDSLVFKDKYGLPLYVDRTDYKYSSTYLFSLECVGHKSELCYKKSGHRIDISVGVTFPFSNLERGECYIENTSSANEVEINKYKEMHQDKRRLFGKVINTWKEKIIEYSKINVFKGDIIPKKEEEKPKRISMDKDGNLMSNIEFLLLKLKNYNEELYKKYQDEYNKLLSNSTNMQVIPITNSLEAIKAKIEFALEFNKNGGMNISTYLNNKKYEYLENILNNSDIKTALTIKELDKIMELFLKIQFEFNLSTRRNIMRDLSLLYILELYENKDIISEFDLDNSYINDIIMSIIVTLNSLKELGVIDNDLIIDLADDLKLSDIIEIIKKMQFKNLESEKIKKISDKTIKGIWILNRVC